MSSSDKYKRLAYVLPTFDIYIMNKKVWLSHEIVHLLASWKGLTIKSFNIIIVLEILKGSCTSPPNGTRTSSKHVLNMTVFSIHISLSHLEWFTSLFSLHFFSISRWLCLVWSGCACRPKSQPPQWNVQRPTSNLCCMEPHLPWSYDTCRFHAA